MIFYELTGSTMHAGHHVPDSWCYYALCYCYYCAVIVLLLCCYCAAVKYSPPPLSSPESVATSLTLTIPANQSFKPELQATSTTDPVSESVKY